MEGLRELYKAELGQLEIIQEQLKGQNLTNERKGDLKDEKEDIEANLKNIFSQKMVNFFNSSPTNILLFRPALFPFLGGLTAIIVVFIVTGFYSSLSRVAIFAFITGMATDKVLQVIHEKAGNFIDSIVWARETL